MAADRPATQPSSDGKVRIGTYDNRAVAVAQSGNAERALGIVDSLAASGQLDDYYLLHSTRAELLRRLGRTDEAAAEFARARDLATNEVERAYLESRRIEVSGRPPSAGPFD